MRMRWRGRSRSLINDRVAMLDLASLRLAWYCFLNLFESHRAVNARKRVGGFSVAVCLVFFWVIVGFPCSGMARAIVG